MQVGARSRICMCSFRPQLTLSAPVFAEANGPQAEEELRNVQEDALERCEECLL